MIFSKINSKSFLILSLFSTLFIVSCNDSEKKVENEVQTSQEATLEQKKQALDRATPSQSTNTTTASGDLALNPAHGQPGHDCKVPVGAPLNGSKTTSPQTINVNDAAPVKATSSGNGNLNPAHGQPGHRCDIEVGQPL